MKTILTLCASLLLIGCATSEKMYMGEPVVQKFEENGKYYFVTDTDTIWVFYRDFKLKP